MEIETETVAEAEAVDSITSDEAIMNELFNTEECRFVEENVMQPSRSYFEPNRVDDELVKERQMNASLRALLDVERGYVAELNKEVAMLRGSVTDTLLTIKVRHPTVAGCNASHVPPNDPWCG
jgi:hypothetical protein